jgi:hypothetical protein
MTELTATTNPRVFWHPRNPKRLHITFPHAHFLMCMDCGGMITVTHLVEPDRRGWLPSFRMCMCIGIRREVSK